MDPHDMRRSVGIAGLAIVAFALTACDAGQSQDQVDPLDPEAVSQMSVELAEQGFPEQALALEDGKVDADEYDAAFELLRECVEAKGYGVSDPVVSPLNGTAYEFAYKDNGRKVEDAISDYESCEAKYWYPTSFIYTDTAPQKITEPLRDAIVQCLERAGESVEADADTYTELVGGIDAPQGKLEVAADCAQEAAYELYPELMTLSVTLQGIGN